MAVRIRLQRKGARHMAFYRIVVADSRCPRDGRFVEQLGYYDPLRDPPEIKIDTPKVIDWLSKGACPSGTVESLLRRVGIMQMWHEVKRGRSLDELAHIEDEARKRIEAKSSMEKRTRAEAKPAKKDVEEKAETHAEERSAAPAAADIAHQAPAPEEPAVAAGSDGVAVAESMDAAPDSGGGASQDEVEAGAPDSGEDTPAVSEEKKPE